MYIGCCNNIILSINLENREDYLQKYKFGTKIYAEDYTPNAVNHSKECEIFFTHDNGGRPFKVYIDNENKETWIYSLNRNLIFEKKSHQSGHTKSDIILLSTNTSTTSVQLAMNDVPQDLPDLSRINNSERDNNDSDTVESDAEYDTYKYYDQLVAYYKYECVWIGGGEYLTRDISGQVVQSKSNHFTGNSILYYIGKTEDLKNRYVFVGERVEEFITDDEIQKYYSTVGNSDVPYPVAIGKKYLFFMLDMDAEPIQKYKNLTEEQLSDAYSYYYGHRCVKCHRWTCDCKIDKYESISVESKLVCKRDF